MSPASTTGAQAICTALRVAGVEVVFGLPGTQNIALFEALRKSCLRTVPATNELSAAMMANGYYRASGRVAALVTIPGPGLTWALTGLAEAALDSAALLHLVGKPASSPGRRYQLQAFDQTTMARPVSRAVLALDDVSDAGKVVAEAHAWALAGEPGPVVIEIADTVLHATVSTGVVAGAAHTSKAAPGPVIDAATLDATVDAIANAPRCLILAGQGCQHAAAHVQRLAERLSAAVATTTSGRGVLAEDHPLSLGFECAGNGAGTLNAAIESCDLVLALGCKFSHNGSHGFDLRLPADKLIHVDTASEVPGANYPVRLAIQADTGAFATALLKRLDQLPSLPAGFDVPTLARLRERGRIEVLGEGPEPRIHGIGHYDSAQPAAFFAALRRAMPRDSCLVTDSGLHQVLARRHFRVLCPRGLLTPTNLQSMGFAIGAAIGACIADPTRPTVALIGDGGLAMSGLELLTAIRQGLRLTVIVFVDGGYGLIRTQQLATHGHPHATEFSGPDCAALAAAVGARHVRLQGDAEAVLREAITGDGVTLIEVAVGDSLPMHWMRAKGMAKNILGPKSKSWLQRLLRRS